jgi:AAA domain (dynein-related subfamily)
VVAAFSDGVFNGGRAWMNRRWAQLSFLVEFAEHFKQQDQVIRDAARTDPVLLRRLVMESPGHHEPAQRHALLYLFQPRFFLPIVSEEHRQLLRNGLGSEYLPDGPTDDLDADLHTIMETLERQAGGPVDVYDDTWRPRWLERDKPSPQPRTPSPGDQQPGSAEPRPYSVADIIKAGSFHPAKRLQQILDHWRDKQNLVLQGAPGTGKTWLAKKLAQALIGSHAPDAIRSVQFHPNTSYEDFVRGWRPTAGPDGSGHLELTDGALLQHAKLARQSDIPHVLIIEEINRGNPAQAFGEMLTLIEKSKRNADDALTLSYPKPEGEQYFLPPNLYLLGTMNIADRSLALVDFALRRRFSFETLEPALTDAWAQYLQAKLPNDDTTLVEAIRSKIEDLNVVIAEDEMLGAHFKIGHSFVTPTDPQSDGHAWFTGVIDTEIAPLLAEYWFDDRAKAQSAVDALRL